MANTNGVPIWMTAEKAVRGTGLHLECTKEALTELGNHILRNGGGPIDLQRTKTNQPPAKACVKKIDELPEHRCALYPTGVLDSWCLLLGDGSKRLILISYDGNDDKNGKVDSLVVPQHAIDSSIQTFGDDYPAVFGWKNYTEKEYLASKTTTAHSSCVGSFMFHQTFNISSTKAKTMVQQENKAAKAANAVNSVLPAVNPILPGAPLPAVNPILLGAPPPAANHDVAPLDEPEALHAVIMELRSKLEEATQLVSTETDRANAAEERVRTEKSGTKSVPPPPQKLVRKLSNSVSH